MPGASYVGDPKARFNGIKRMRTTLRVEQQTYIDEVGERLVGASSYEIAVGGGQPTTAAPKATGSLMITGEFRLEP